MSFISNFSEESRGRVFCFKDILKWVLEPKWPKKKGGEHGIIIWTRREKIQINENRLAFCGRFLLQCRQTRRPVLLQCPPAPGRPPVFPGIAQAPVWQRTGPSSDKPSASLGQVSCLCGAGLPTASLQLGRTRERDLVASRQPHSLGLWQGHTQGKALPSFPWDSVCPGEYRQEQVGLHCPAPGLQTWWDTEAYTRPCVSWASSWILFS